MRILTLESRGEVYTSQVYLVLGDFSRIEDVNTLVDVGQDPAVFASIQRAPTGVGKIPVEQVVLTHGHSDHCAILPWIQKAFHPTVFAFSPHIDGAGMVLCDGDTIRMGDQDFEVIHTPGHSSDSVCFYDKTEGVLFAGDTPLIITSATGTHEAEFLAALEKLCARDIRRVYFGHGAPLTGCCNERLRESLRLATRGLRANGLRERAGNRAPATA
jgi:glyoxylase-like metal-dependent hydrolase (beta-lactamase superfamily II)